MKYAFPCILAPDPPGYVVTFPDIPEAITGGGDLEESLEMAEDALAAALGGYVADKRLIPTPSLPTEGQRLVAVPPVVAAKLALYSAMRTQHVTNVALAARLGISEGAVRKLVNPDHRSHIGQVERALKLLGRQLVIEDAAA